MTKVTLMKVTIMIKIQIYNDETDFIYFFLDFVSSAKQG